MTQPPSHDSENSTAKGPGTDLTHRTCRSVRPRPRAAGRVRGGSPGERPQVLTTTRIRPGNFREKFSENLSPLPNRSDTLLRQADGRSPDLIRWYERALIVVPLSS